MKIALCCGINRYGGGSDLYGCVNDANDWADGLAARGFDAQRLLDGDAKKDALIHALRSAVGSLKYGDLLVFTFSGHGSWVPDEDGDEIDGRDEVLCPADIGDGRWISDDDLNDVLSQRERGARILFISDSCHSGTVQRFAALPMVAGLSAGSSAFSPRVRFLPPSNFRSFSKVSAAAPPPRPIARPRAAASSCVLFSGCQDWEYSYDAWFGDRPNGAFTRAAIDALASENVQSYADWHRRIRARLPTSEHPQSPQIQGARYQRLWGALEEGR